MLQHGRQQHRLTSFPLGRRLFGFQIEAIKLAGDLIMSQTTGHPLCTQRIAIDENNPFNLSGQEIQQFPNTTAHIQHGFA
jgi:hypothetical protein